MPAISTRRSNRQRKPKPWQKPRSSRPAAKRRCGKTWKYADRSREARRHRMSIRRRDFVALAGAAALAGSLPRLARSADGVYNLDRFGNARILHMTDTHAQLLPVYFREPSVNIGIGAMARKPPHLVGRAFLQRFGISPDS